MEGSDSISVGHSGFVQPLLFTAGIITLLSLNTKLTKSSHKQPEKLWCNTLPKGTLLRLQRTLALIHKEYSSYIAVTALKVTKVSIYF